MPLVEAVPNFSTADPNVIKLIREAFEAVSGVSVLHVDPGAGANRTVFTVAGEAEALLMASKAAVTVALDNIDMRQHTGAHPRIGAVDVFPFVPVRDIGLDGCASIARVLVDWVGRRWSLPVYLYAHSASEYHRVNLADIRRGGYEGLVRKQQDVAWKPDAGGWDEWHRHGAMVIGARPFLVAYNVTLATSGDQKRDLHHAKTIADAVRTAGTPDRLHAQAALKAIGWNIGEYGAAQVSMNLVDIDQTGLAEAFLAVEAVASKIGASIAGSELIGLLPEKALRDSQARLDVSSAEAVIQRLGLDLHHPFRAEERVLEELLRQRGLLTWD